MRQCRKNLYERKRETEYREQSGGSCASPCERGQGWSVSKHNSEDGGEGRDLGASLEGEGNVGVPGIRGKDLKLLMDIREEKEGEEVRMSLLLNMWNLKCIHMR